MQAQGDLLSTLLPLVVLFAIFYFLIIRPQQKTASRHKDMIKNLSRGDKIVTNGGLIVQIDKVEDEILKIKLNDNTIVKMSKEYVSKIYEEEN